MLISEEFLTIGAPKSIVYPHVPDSKQTAIELVRMDFLLAFLKSGWTSFGSPVVQNSSEMNVSAPGLSNTCLNFPNEQFYAKLQHFEYKPKLVFFRLSATNQAILGGELTDHRELWFAT